MLESMNGHVIVCAAGILANTDWRNFPLLGIIHDVRTASFDHTFQCSCISVCLMTRVLLLPRSVLGQLSRLFRLLRRVALH